MFFSVSKDDNKVDLEFPNETVGQVAAILLATASNSFLVANQKGEAIQKAPRPPSFVPVQPTQFVLGSSQRPGHIVFVFKCGDAEIGFEMRTADLAGLGRALIALGAEGSAH